MKAKKDKQSIRHVIKNTWYMLRILLKNAPDVFIVNMLSTVIYSVLNFLSGTWLLQYVINGFQNGMKFEKALLAIVMIGGIQLFVEILLTAYSRFRSPIVNLKLEKILNMRLYKVALGADLECYENKEFYDSYVKASGEFLNRVYSASSNCNRLLSIILTFTMYSFFILKIDPFLVVFAVFPVLITSIFGKKQNKIRHEYDMKRREEERQREYTRRTFYLADYAKEMRLTNIYRVMFERFDTSCKNIIGYINKYGWRLGVIDYIIRESRDVIASMGAMFYSVYATLVKGTMQYGDCLVIINSINGLTWSLSSTVNTYLRFHEDSIYVDTIREFLEYQPKIKGGNTDCPKKGCLELKNISFRYRGQSDYVLKNINIKVNAGEKIALVGNNGAGKSTIAKLMMRLYDPDEGEVRYDGKNVKEYKLTGEGGYRERISVVFQDFKLFSLTVAENVLLRRKKSGENQTVEKAIEASGIKDKVESFENGIETVLTREFDSDGVVLSGGEGQKISIARTFASNSGIVILDEPTSALDPIAEYRMYENMMKATKDRSVVFISHRLSSATLADRIYYIENGEVIEEGSHEELMKKEGKYSQMFKIQAENYSLEKEAEYV